jgi:hypothetical protein
MGHWVRVVGCCIREKIFRTNHSVGGRPRFIFWVRECELFEGTTIIQNIRDFRIAGAGAGADAGHRKSINVHRILLPREERRASSFKRAATQKVAYSAIEGMQQTHARYFFLTRSHHRKETYITFASQIALKFRDMGHYSSTSSEAARPLARKSRDVTLTIC